MIARIARTVVAIEFVVAAAAIIYAGVHDVDAVFSGSPAGIPLRIVATCEAAEPSRPCDVVTDELNPGRYRVATSAPAASLILELHASAPERARHLLTRVSQPTAARMELDRPAAAGAAPAIELSASAGRTVTDLRVAPVIVRVAASRTVAEVSPTPIVFDELGLFESSDALKSDARPFFSSIPPFRYHTVLVPHAVAALCLFTLLAAPFVSGRWLKATAPIALAAVCFSLSLVDLAATYSPHVTRDLRTVYAADAVHDTPGSNLNGGLWLGFRFLHGSGLTITDGVAPWERMPGYGLFAAAAGALFGHKTLLDLAIATVWLQVLFYSASLGVFAWAAGQVFAPAAVWAAGMFIAWLPKELGLTQVDAIIAAVALLVLAALCVRLKFVRSARSVPLGVDVVLHGTFALWFAMRPDVLPGWAAVSLFLYWRRWRRALIPLAFFLLVGGVWGAYKAHHGRDFSLTTTSAGASLFCGLWEVPSRFRYAMACTDEAYFDWIGRHTPYVPQSAAASSFATREVLKFWLTYPGHFVLMVYHKLMEMLNGDIWPGYPTQLQVFVFGAIPRFWLVMSLVAVIAICVAIGHERERTLLLAWPLWFDAPLFWVMFASLGRFYSAAGVALVAAAIPPLFEAPFYRTIALRPVRAAVALACVGLFAAMAWPVHRWLLAWDAFHYWTPFLNPATSLLNEYK